MLEVGCPLRIPRPSTHMVRLPWTGANSTKGQAGEKGGCCTKEWKGDTVACQQNMSKWAPAELRTVRRTTCRTADQGVS